MTYTGVNVEETKKNLKNMIAERGYTPSQIIEACHLGSVQAVYKWYSDTNNCLPNLDTFALLIAFLDCKFEDIYVYI